MKVHTDNAAGLLGNAIGKGLLAGIAGTAAISISQMIEMKITKREPSDATLKVTGAVTDVKPANKQAKEKVSQEIHWVYGTAWGVARGLIALTGLKGLPAAAVHFAANWGTSLIMLPKYKAGPPIQEEDAKTIVIDVMHHAVYALAAGFAYDALDYQKPESKLDSVLEDLKLKNLVKRAKEL